MANNKENNQNLVQLISVFQEAFKDERKMAADLNPAIDAVINSLTLNIEEDKISTVEYLLFERPYEEEIQP